MSIILARLRRYRRKVFARSAGKSPVHRARRSRTSLTAIALSLLFLACGIVLLNVAWLGSLASLESDTPRTTSLKWLEIDLAGKLPITIGSNELAQRAGFSSAEIEHVLIDRDKVTGAVQISNIARERRLFLQYSSGVKTFAAHWRIANGDIMRVRNETFTFHEAENGVLEFSRDDSGGSTNYRLETRGYLRDVLIIGGTRQRDCASHGNRLAGLLTRRAKRTAIYIGGKLNCYFSGAHHVPTGTLAWKAVVIGVEAGGFYIAPGPDGGNPVGISFERDKAITSGFKAIAWKIDDPELGRLVKLVIGRTSYAVSNKPGSAGIPWKLMLAPLDKTHLFRVEEAAVSQEPCPTGYQGVPPASKYVTRCLELAGAILSRVQGADVLATLNTNERIFRLGLVLTPVLLAALMLIAGLGRRALAWRAKEQRLLGAASHDYLWMAGIVPVVAAAAFMPEMLEWFFDRPVGLIDGMRNSALALFLCAVVLITRNAGRPFFSAGFLAIFALMAAGSVVLLSLALDGDTTHWIGFAGKHKLLFLDPLAVWAALFLTMPLAWIGGAVRYYLFGRGYTANFLRLSLAAVPVGLIGLWTAVGSEEGVLGFQPVEIAKTTLVLLFATLMVGLTQSVESLQTRSYRAFLWTALVVIVGFVIVLMFLPVLKRDFSPVLIIGLVLVLMLQFFLLPWAFERILENWRRSERIDDAPAFPRYPVRSASRGSRVAGLAIAACVVLAFAVLNIFNIAGLAFTGVWGFPSDPNTRLERLDEARRWSVVGTIAERFFIFFDLSDDPADRKQRAGGPVNGTWQPVFRVSTRDLGLQVLRSKQALAKAPCKMQRVSSEFADPSEWISAIAVKFTGNTCAQEPLDYYRSDDAAPAAEGGGRYFIDNLIRIPVIHNDFIGTYLTVRLGLAAALLVMALQSIVILFCFYLFRAIRPPAAVGETERLVRQFLRMCLAGITVLFSLHWIIAWSNIIGILPVMGQPMSFVAAATSHHIFTIAPSILIMILAARYSENPLGLQVRSPPVPWKERFFKGW